MQVLLVEGEELFPLTTDVLIDINSLVHDEVKGSDAFSR